MKTVKLPLLLSACFAAAAFAQQAPEPETLELPSFLVLSERVANQEPGGTMPMPVSGLRFEPRVDVQGRNLAEAQADITLRGGIFENTGFKLGGAAVYDPQTGHYFAELPVAPAMLEAPQVLTGWQNALQGMNAGVGTIAYGWRPIETRGELSLSAGDHGFLRGSLYQGFARDGNSGLTFAGDLEAARSESDGSVPFGEHEFERLAGRLQVRSASSQTDLFGGYQGKFFGWPNLYTPFGFNETENLQTVLALLNHRWVAGDGSFLQASAYYRRNKDDYEFNRAVPGASNPFLHTTWTRSLALEGRADRGEHAWNFSAHWLRDKLQSTALTAGRFNSRSIQKLTLVPERKWSSGRGELEVRAGGSYDDSNRNAARFSPIAAAAVTTASGNRWHVEYSEATQLPTYTALNSSATSGLFRGNANLGRSIGRNLEAGVAASVGGWQVEAAAFRREDEDLVDWTFARGVVARTANPVDIATSGVELVATRRTATLDLVFGYTWLDKDSDYGPATVDASFYALNFAKHRLTAAATWRFARGWQLRADNELRVQEDNFLRTVGGDEAVVSSLGLYYFPPALPGFEFSVLIDNLWETRFQEVPAVPAAGRQVSVGVVKRW
jgi:vitamin B12 transporter